MKICTIQLGEFATLTCFLHERSKQLVNLHHFPGLLILPGGGFRFCSEAEGEPIAMRFFAEGFNAFVLDYTTVTKKPDAVMADPMNDTRNALTWIRENAEEIDTDPARIAMIGFSGGGHLASAVSTHGDIRPDALILGYPGIVHSDLRALDCPDIPESVDASTPPSFIFSTSEDPVTPPVHPLTFAMALTKAKVPFELHIFEKGTHGLALGSPLTSQGYAFGVNDAFSTWVPTCLRWLREHFGDFEHDRPLPDHFG